MTMREERKIEVLTSTVVVLLVGLLPVVEEVDVDEV
jgi:hypothetical protein